MNSSNLKNIIRNSSFTVYRLTPRKPIKSTIYVVFESIKIIPYAKKTVYFSIIQLLRIALRKIIEFGKINNICLAALSRTKFLFSDVRSVITLITWPQGEILPQPPIDSTHPNVSIVAFKILFPKIKTLRSSDNSTPRLNIYVLKTTLSTVSVLLIFSRNLKIVLHCHRHIVKYWRPK